MLGIISNTTILYVVLLEFGTRQLIKQLHDIVYKGEAIIISAQLLLVSCEEVTQFCETIASRCISGYILLWWVMFPY